jgi:hypothetical protein
MAATVAAAITTMSDEGIANFQRTLLGFVTLHMAHLLFTAPL